VTVRISIVTAVLTLGVVFGQSNHKTAPEPKFTTLSREDSTRLEQQRAVVLAAAKQRYGISALTRTKSDLAVLQKLVDDSVFNKSQTYELQSLGVAFGDVLASELPLRWVMVTDEFGTDPTLRFKETTIQINALTMISKRVEEDEPVSVQSLLDNTREQVAAKGAKPEFGPNVLIFDPSTPSQAIQKQIDAVYATQEHNEFGPQRNARCSCQETIR